jgi:hypothetical protein
MSKYIAKGMLVQNCFIDINTLETSYSGDRDDGTRHRLTWTKDDPW